MGFKPKNNDHAIVEVAFAVTLTAPMSAARIVEIVGSFDDWKDELPIREEIHAHNFAIGGPVPTAVVPQTSELGGVLFRSVNRDATLDWQVRFQENTVVVNCGNYSRWNNVWPTARRYLVRALTKALSESTAISQLGLEYVDEFIWEGSSDSYNGELLIGSGNTFIHGDIVRKGPRWHFHAGWFDVKTSGYPAECLERIHIDSVRRSGEFISRIDTTVRLDLLKPLVLKEALAKRSVAEATGDDYTFMDGLFVDLHGRNKALFRRVIASDVAERIKLDA